MIFNKEAYFTVPQGKVAGETVSAVVDAKYRIRIVVPDALPQDAILCVPVTSRNGCLSSNHPSEVPMHGVVVRVNEVVQTVQ